MSIKTIVRNRSLLAAAISLTGSLVVSQKLQADTLPIVRDGIAIPRLCQLQSHVQASMNDDLTFRFEPGVLCPLKTVQINNLDSDRTEGIYIFISGDASKKNEGHKRPAYFSSTRYTIWGSHRFPMTTPTGGLKFVENWEVIAQDTTFKPQVTHHIADNSYDSIKVTVATDEIFRLCQPVLRPTPDGGFIDTGAWQCAADEVVGKLGATVDFIYDYIPQE